MDFHTLTRRQLQTLCKKNKIPANITNVAMADALFALPTVEGMEELSPAKSLDGGASTCRTTALRRRSVKDESDENLQPSTTRTTRRSTRKDVQMRQTPAKMETLDFTGIEEEEEGAENDGNGKQKCNLPHHTPAPVVVPASRQRGINLKGGETTVTRAQGTRRSTRLAVKNAQGNNGTNSDDYQRSQTIPKKMDFEEILKGPDCSSHDDVDLVAESFGGIDLNENSEEGLEKSNDAGALSVEESDCSAKKQNQSDVGLDEDDGSQDSELVESKMIVDADGDGAGRDICNNVSKDGDDANRTEETFEIGEELDANFHVAAEDQNDADAFSVEIGINLNMSKEEEVDSNQDGEPSHNDLNISQTETKNAVLDDGTEQDEQKVEFSDFATESLDDEKKDTNLEDMDPSRTDITVVESDESGDSEMDSKTEEQDVGITEPTIEPSVEVSSATEEALEDTLAEKFDTMGLTDCGVDPSSISEEEEERMKDSTGSNAVTIPVYSSVTLEQLGGHGALEMENKPKEEEDLNTSMELNFEKCSTRPQDSIAADSNENLSNFQGETSAIQFSVRSINYLSTEINLSVSPSPRKIPLLQKAVSKTPTSAKRMMIKVSDDKENNIIDNSGTKLMMITTSAKEKNEKKDIFLIESGKPWDGTSLRKLKKELKAKLEKANNNNIKAACTRPALQALTENQQVADSS